MTDMGVNPQASSGGASHASAIQSVGAYTNDQPAGATGGKVFDWSNNDDCRAVLVQVY
jgi:hypothetical protein